MNFVMLVFLLCLSAFFQLDRKEKLAALKARVHGWTVSNPDEVLKIYAIKFRYQKTHGRNALEDELGEELKKTNIKLPFSIHTLLKFW